MADMKLSVNFIPESSAISSLVSQVQGAFSKGITVKFNADTSGLFGKSGGSRDATSILNGYKLSTAASRAVGAVYDANAKSARAEAAAIGAKTAALRLANAEEAKATKVAKQAATSERRTRQDALDYKYLKRQSEDYFKTYEKNILKNKDLTAEWADYNKRVWKDPLEQRTALQEMMSRTREAGAEVETLGQRIKRLFGQHFDTALVMLGINALRQGLKELWTNVKDVNTVLTQFQIVSRMSNSDLNAFANDAFDSAKKISASFTSVVDAATVYKRLGYSTEDSLNFAELTTMYSKVGDVDISDAESNITAMVKAFDLSSADLQGALDKMVFVGNNFPVSAAQLGEGLQNASSSLAAGGNSLEQSIALLTSANTTVQDISKSSTGLRTITARIRNTGVELEALGEGALDEAYNTIPKYREKLLALSGVDILDGVGEFRSTYDIISDISDVWKTLDSQAQSAITTMVAGVRQTNVFNSLVSEFGEAEKIMSSIDDSGGAMSGAYETYSASIEAAINRIDTAFQKLSSDTLDSNFASGFLDAGTSILNILDQMVTKLGLIPTLAGGVGAVLGFNNQGIIGKNGNSNEYALYSQAA